MNLDPSSIRRVVVRQAQRAEAVVQARHQGAVAAHQSQRNQRQGEPWLIVESDGSMGRTGEWQRDPVEGLSAKRQRPKRPMQTWWREVRLGMFQAPQAEKRWYGAVLDSPPKVGEQMFALALLAGYGYNT